MKLLLDTHAFVWWITDDVRLTPRARRAIADGRNEVLVSAVTAWEIIVKSALGRVKIPDPERTIPEQIHENAFAPLPLLLRHALKVAALPDLHRDPFDRLLIAQAIVEDASLVTGDRTVARYPVNVRW